MKIEATRTTAGQPMGCRRVSGTGCAPTGAEPNGEAIKACQLQTEDLVRRGIAIDPTPEMEALEQGCTTAAGAWLSFSQQRAEIPRPLLSVDCQAARIWAPGVQLP